VKPYTQADIADELDRAMVKFPTWPTDPFHALGILGEEYGELIKAVVEFTYEPGKSSFDDVRKEAIQTAAMAIRWLENIDRYSFNGDGTHRGNI